MKQIRTSVVIIFILNVAEISCFQQNFLFMVTYISVIIKFHWTAGYIFIFLYKLKIFIMKLYIFSPSFDFSWGNKLSDVFLYGNIDPFTIWCSCLTKYLIKIGKNFCIFRFFYVRNLNTSFYCCILNSTLNMN